MYTIRNVNWINLHNKTIEQRDINISSHEDKTIDGTGQYLMPGLVDMHTHIVPASAKHYVYSGVTTVRNTGGNYELLRSIDGLSPNIYSTYRFIDGAPGLWGPTSFGVISTNDIDTAVAAVKELHSQRAQFVKVYGNIQEDVLSAVVKESRVYGLEVAADFLHSKTINAVKAADYGVTWLEHASSIVQSLFPNYHSGVSEETFNSIQKEQIDENKLSEVLTHLIRNDVKIVPTLSLYKHLSEEKRTFNTDAIESSKQYALFLHEDTFTVNEQFSSIQSSLSPFHMKKEAWQYRQIKHITKRYIELGGRVYIGTDAPAGAWVYPGLSMIEELNEFKDLGLDNYDILHKATVEAREVTGSDDSYILMRHNPIENFAHILNLNAVFLNGRYYMHEDIATHRINVDTLQSLIREITKKY